MCHDHVAEGACVLVEGRPVADGERLRDVDLDVLDVVPVPDRFEQPVGEAQGEDVLRRLLAEVVVDPEDLLFVEVPRAAGRSELAGASRGRGRKASR